MSLRPLFHGHEESAFAEVSLPLEVLHTRIGSAKTLSHSCTAPECNGFAAANGAKVYVVDRNAKLYVLDLNSGKVIETTQFAFPSKTAQSSGIYNSIFGTQLFFTDNIMGIYFNDLKILSAYSGL